MKGSTVTTSSRLVCGILVLGLSSSCANPRTALAFRPLSFVTTPKRPFVLSSPHWMKRKTPSDNRSSEKKNHKEMSSYGGGRGGRGGRGGGGGRGEYYKNKYGGGGRGGRGGRGGGDRGGGNANNDRQAMGGGSYSDLAYKLRQIDGRQYPSYHDLETPPSKGWYNEMIGFTLYVGRTQSDPFAPPTRCKLVVSSSTAKFPPSLYSNKIRSVALGDYLQRALHANCVAMGADASLEGKGWSGPKGGDVQILEPCQHVLEQTAVCVDRSTGDISAQVTINLPARGRTILGQAAEQIFNGTLQTLVSKALMYESLNSARIQQHVDSVEDQVWLRNQLEAKNLIAFIPDGSILPRKSGVNDTPMSPNEAIKFESPSTLQISFTLPNAKREISGMGIKKGITLITGGGFHGKSTLLSALQVGMYPKIPGDGREFVVTNDTAIKIRAEDGRQVSSVDISSFITNLPFGKDTTCFTTPDASGSTSQASNIVEALEMGAQVLLVDEDTCATNFMIRDDKMMQLVAAEKEPITPFVRKVRSLYEDHGVSSILVIGGSGDYFDVADNVVMMDCYHCTDVTERAKEIVAKASAQTGTIRHDASASVPFGSFTNRIPVGEVYRANGKVSVRAKNVISYGDVEMDLSGLEQIVAKSQTSAISLALQKLPIIASTGHATLMETLILLEKTLDQQGLDALAPGQFNGGLARPRPLEIAFAVNRLRKEGSIVQKK